MHRCCDEERELLDLPLERYKLTAVVQLNDFMLPYGPSPGFCCVFNDPNLFGGMGTWVYGYI